MLQSVTIRFKNKNRKAATGRAQKHLPSLAWWIIPQACTLYKEGANAVPKGEEKGGWGRGWSCSWSCSGHLKLSTASLRYAKHFPCNLTHSPHIGRHFFHQVSPKDYVHHELPPAKSNSLVQHMWWEATDREESLLSLRWVRRALKKGTCPFSMMERCSMVINFSHIRLGAWLEILQGVFQQPTHFQEDWGILRTVGSRSNSPRTL